MEKPGIEMIEPMATYVMGSDVDFVEMGLLSKGERGGVYMLEYARGIDLWGLGWHYWIEIAGLMAVMLIVIGMVGIYRRRRKLADVRPGESYCSHCGYGLSGLKQGASQCPECGAKDVGESGKRRRVMKRIKGGTGWRWAMVFGAVLIAAMTGVFWFGAENEHVWVDNMAKVMGAGDGVKVKSSYAGDDQMIRRLGIKSWLKGKDYESRWAYRACKAVLSDELMKVVDGHSVQQVNVLRAKGVGRVRGKDGDAGRVEIKTISIRGIDDWDCKPQENLHIGQVPTAPMLIRFGDRTWFYEGWIGSHHDRLFMVDESKNVMQEIVFDQSGMAEFYDLLRGRPETMSYKISDGLYLLHQSNHWEAKRLGERAWHHFYVFDFDQKVLGHYNSFADVMEMNVGAWMLVQDALMKLRLEHLKGDNQVGNRQRFFEILGDRWMSLSEPLEAKPVEYSKHIAYMGNFTYTIPAIDRKMSNRWRVRGDMKGDMGGIMGRDVKMNTDGEIFVDRRASAICKIAMPWDAIVESRMDDEGYLYVIGMQKHGNDERFGVWVYDLPAPPRSPRKTFGKAGI
ncbi:zinc ribbon domain-containing protein [Poriferisphaera corsica]|nr:zinc ribbon domain-containing protein [Poriferisphaera corsica]